MMLFLKRNFMLYLADNLSEKIEQLYLSIYPVGVVPILSA